MVRSVSGRRPRHLADAGSGSGPLRRLEASGRERMDNVRHCGQPPENCGAAGTSRRRRIGLPGRAGNPRDIPAGLPVAPTCSPPGLGRLHQMARGRNRLCLAAGLPRRAGEVSRRALVVCARTGPESLPGRIGHRRGLSRGDGLHGAAVACVLHAQGMGRRTTSRLHGRPCRPAACRHETPSAGHAGPRP